METNIMGDIIDYSVRFGNYSSYSNDDKYVFTYFNDVYTVNTTHTYTTSFAEYDKQLEEFTKQYKSQYNELDKDRVSAVAHNAHFVTSYTGGVIEFDNGNVSGAYMNPNDISYIEYKMFP